MQNANWQLELPICILHFAISFSIDAAYITAMYTTSQSSPRRPVLRFLRKRLDGWLVRHQNPFNFAIHLIGIPLAVAGIGLLFVAPWYWGVGSIVLGYFLQWLGHRVEGNDVGEWAGIKRLLGLPYVAISPRYQNPTQPPTA